MASPAVDAFDDEDAEAARASALIQEVNQLTGVGCANCTRPICGHEALFSIVLGLKDAPRCLACLAAGLDRPAVELRDQLREHIQHRDCFRQAWQAAGGDANHAGIVAEGDSADSCRAEQEGLPPPDGGSPQAALPDSPACLWDAGDMSCGELVLALRLRLDRLSPGTILEVIARDRAAPEDLPAWCRMTGHRLLQSAHPRYRIQRKER